MNSIYCSLSFLCIEIASFSILSKTKLTSNWLNCKLNQSSSNINTRGCELEADLWFIICFAFIACIKFCLNLVLFLCWPGGLWWWVWLGLVCREVCYPLWFACQFQLVIVSKLLQIFPSLFRLWIWRSDHRNTGHKKKNKTKKRDTRQ